MILDQRVLNQLIKKVKPLENMFDAGNFEDLYAYEYDWDNLRDFFVGDFQKIIGSVKVYLNTGIIAGLIAEGFISSI